MAQRWRHGGLVILPTETVYGLAADAENGQAVASIYAVKARPRINPLIVHVSTIAMAQRYAAWSATAQQLAEAFWPGPLTLVLPRHADCPASDLVSAGGPTIALRCPAHPLALAAIAALGRGVAAPSANRSGRVSPTTLAHVQAELGDQAALMVDGGPCQFGLESTVFDLSGARPHLLRPGTITRARLAECIGLPVDAAITPAPDSQAALRAPGMLASHYAPALPVRLNATSVNTGEALLAFGPAPLTGAAAMRNLSASADLSEAAANLFSALRALDDPAYTGIAVMPIPQEGIGEAIHDRLTRAAVPRTPA